jgi:hypothetical protein
VTAQIPVVQLGATAQTFPHVPQLFLSLAVFAQTPWTAQAVRPPLQVKLHEPLHAAVPFVGTGHTLHVAPHFVVSSSAAHSAPHAWKFVLHVKSHVLLVHVASPFKGVGHLFPHEPQLLGLLAVTTHWSLHFASLGWQLETHVGAAPDPLAQSGALAGHTVEHEPQCWGEMSTQALSQRI